MAKGRGLKWVLAVSTSADGESFVSRVRGALKDLDDGTANFDHLVLRVAGAFLESRLEPGVHAVAKAAFLKALEG